MADKSQASLLAYLPLASFIQNVSSRSPAPGGGSVAALSGSLGASLGAMVCRLTIGKKKYKEVEDLMRNTEKLLLPLRDKLRDLIDDDTQAFDSVMEAFGLPDGTPEEKKIKDEQIMLASQKAAMVPLHVMKKCLEAVELLKDVAHYGNVNSISDAGVANYCLKTGFEGAKLNVLINTKDMEDSQWKSEVMNEVKELSVVFEDAYNINDRFVLERLG
ncbi:MAG: cyclodeaminase/cyclohydrolase family protein [Deltaproteobacteria bacterium]|nr:cyclodeaminase/cyclohydrolase family protein [Deltaproteobacteria bacterium]